MDNKKILSKIAIFQQNDNWHKLTCGNDSQHLPLVGKEKNGNIILGCLNCDYEQNRSMMLVWTKIEDCPHGRNFI